MNKIKRFFWLCSGSHVRTLEEVPSEGAKYAGIGATIFFTGLFAAIAAAYAIYTFTDNLWVSSAVGILWGGMIFNLDRYIVSSMRKSSSWKKEWLMASPRIVLALIISLVIARPLELKIFEKEIVTELNTMNQELLRASQDSLTNYYNRLILEDELAIATLQKPILALESKRDSLRYIATVEADGTGGTMRRNAGPIYQIKKANADKVEAELETLRNYNTQLISSKRENQTRLEEERNTKLLGLANPDFTGLAARLEALTRLTNKSYSIWLANLFIILLFIAIETAPVMVKLISGKGPYDYRLQTIEYEEELLWLGRKAQQHAKVKKAATKVPQKEQAYIDQYLTSNLN